MKKIFEIIKKVLLSERLNRIIVRCFYYCITYTINILLFIPGKNIGAKIIVIGYLMSTMVITVFLRIPSLDYSRLCRE